MTSFSHSAVLDPEIKNSNFIFPTKYVIPKSLKLSHWPSKFFENEINEFALRIAGWGSFPSIF